MCCETGARFGAALQGRSSLTAKPWWRSGAASRCSPLSPSHRGAAGPAEQGKQELSGGKKEEKKKKKASHTPGVRLLLSAVLLVADGCSPAGGWDALCCPAKGWGRVSAVPPPAPEAAVLTRGGCFLMNLPAWASRCRFPHPSRAAFLLGACCSRETPSCPSLPLPPPAAVFPPSFLLPAAARKRWSVWGMSKQAISHGCGASRLGRG